MHGSDALHGDLGTITNEDVLIYISKSGNNSDTIDLINNLKKNKINIISITANKNSHLAKNSKFIIYTPIDKEACPNNLAPTTSSGIQLLVGDIIAISLMSLKNFDSKSFAKFHPAGSLGKRLTITVEDLVNTNKPIVKYESVFSDAVKEISTKMQGATAVLKNKKVVGIITDGDIRRAIDKSNYFFDMTAQDFMSHNFISVNPDDLASKCLNIMAEKKIGCLAVMQDDALVGVINQKDLVKLGI